MKNFRLCRHLLFFFLLTRGGLLEAQLFTEDFESYAVGDYISIEGAPAWAVWVAGNEGGAMDSQISDEAALSGTQSMKIFGDVAGGPMDIMLVAGLTGAYEITFNMLIPEGNAGYYNVQENQSPGVAWAFECNLNGNGSVNYNIDGSTYTLDATYTPGAWLKITHFIDTDSDLMDLYYDDVYLGQLPYDGGQIGGVNFYAAGDGINVPTYYIDDVVVDVTDPVTVWQQEGCTDANACNYNPAALVEDGSCDYSCFGCTDSSAVNFNPEATVEDGSCSYFETSCEFLGDEAWDDLDLGLYPAAQALFTQGEYQELSLVLNFPQVVVEPSSGSAFAMLSWTPTEVEGMPDALDFVGLSGGAGGTQLCMSMEGIGWDVGIHEVVVHGDLVLSVFGNPYAVGDYPLELTVEVLANPDGIPGCTYANATNYNAFATIDNGNCEYHGCTDPEALNFYPFITLDDGSCLYGDVVGPTCPSDIDQDGAVTTSDLLSLLSTFGLDCQ